MSAGARPSAADGEASPASACDALMPPLSRLSMWWMKMGIVPKRIAAGYLGRGPSYITPPEPELGSELVREDTR